MYKTSFFFFFILLFSCKKNPEFRVYTSLENGWPSSKTIGFTVPSIARAPSSVFIHIRNNNDYPFANIFLVAQMKDSVNVIFRDTLEYAMANAKGEWLGSGFLEVKENKLWWKYEWTPEHKGPYFIELSQSVRNSGAIEGVPLLNGILNVGVEIEPLSQAQ